MTILVIWFILALNYSTLSGNIIRPLRKQLFTMIASISQEVLYVWYWVFLEYKLPISETSIYVNNKSMILQWLSLHCGHVRLVPWHGICGFIIIIHFVIDLLVLQVVEAVDLISWEHYLWCLRVDSPLRCYVHSFDQFPYPSLPLELVICEVCLVVL